MVYIISALFSMIIIFVVLLFLPLKLSRKDLLIVVSVGFIIAVFVNFLSILYSYWIAIIGCVLLLITAYFILNQKMNFNDSSDKKDIDHKGLMLDEADSEEVELNSVDSGHSDKDEKQIGQNNIDELIQTLKKDNENERNDEDDIYSPQEIIEENQEDEKNVEVINNNEDDEFTQEIQNDFQFDDAIGIDQNERLVEKEQQINKIEEMEEESNKSNEDHSLESDLEDIFELRKDMYDDETEIVSNSETSEALNDIDEESVIENDEESITENEKEPESPIADETEDLIEIEDIQIIETQEEVKREETTSISEVDLDLLQDIIIPEDDMVEKYKQNDKKPSIKVKIEDDVIVVVEDDAITENEEKDFSSIEETKPKENDQLSKDENVEELEEIEMSFEDRQEELPSEEEDSEKRSWTHNLDVTEDEIDRTAFFEELEKLEKLDEEKDQ